MPVSKFLIVTNVNHVKDNSRYFGYAPYINEMNIWLKYVDEVLVVAPLTENKITQIDSFYKHNKIDFREVPDFSFTSIKNSFLSVLKLPIIFLEIFRAMKTADHIHLRCPGNMGLVGCFAQILFPKKIKTAKYAGNWDPDSPQPWTYKLQKWILNNTFLTKNMQVLIYGEWPNQSKNVKSFFTATYLESEKEVIQKTNFDSGVKFVFVGSLVAGKNPMYALKFVHYLIKKGYKVTLDLFGEGTERENLESYIVANKLENSIILKGNQDKESIKESYKKSHFVLLPSKSEGWPKAVAEGMFWGSVPVATKISCIPFMIDHGERGVLLEMNLEQDVQQLKKILDNRIDFEAKSRMALDWSRKYTLDVFQREIEKLVL